MSLAEKPFSPGSWPWLKTLCELFTLVQKLLIPAVSFSQSSGQELFDVGGSPIVITDTEVEIREAQMDLTSVYKFTVYKWIATGSKLFRMILIRISNHAYCGPGLGCTVRTDTILWDYYQMYFVLGSLRQSQWSDEPVWMLVTATWTLKTPSLLTEQ